MHSKLGIGVTLIFALTVIYLWFFVRRKELYRVHNQNVLNLKSKISSHRIHIQTRHANLNAYDFMKHNLDEVLVIQPTIEIT